MSARDFKGFSFVAGRSPEKGNMALMIVILGAAAAIMSYFGVGLQLGFMLVVCIVPTLLSALALSAIKGFKSRWAFLLAFISQALFAIVLFISIIMPSLTLLEALVLWAVMNFAFVTISLVGLTGATLRSKRLVVAVVAPVIAALPLSYAGVLGSVTQREIAILAIGVLGVAFILWLMEYLSSFVIKGVSGFRVLSTFLQGIRGDEVSLSIGIKINALLQYIVFKQGDGYKLLVAPWLHSGPLRGVGGGNLSTHMIEKLNEKHPGSYFVHVPTDHEMDPVSKEVVSKVLDRLEVGEGRTLRVSGMVESMDDEVRVRGQRINDTCVIFLDCKNVDDYDMSITLSIKNRHPEKILMIDQHLLQPMVTSDNAAQFTETADRIYKHVENVIQKLRREPMNMARLGASTHFFEGMSAHAMVLETIKGKTCYFIIDCNGQDPSGVKLIEAVAKSKGIGEVVIMTTDSHSSNIKDLVEGNIVPEHMVGLIMDEALKTGEAKVLFKEVTVPDVPILGPLYYELTTMVKVLSRVFMVIFFSFLLILGAVMVMT